MELMVALAEPQLQVEFEISLYAWDLPQQGGCSPGSLSTLLSTTSKFPDGVPLPAPANLRTSF